MRGVAEVGGNVVIMGYNHHSASPVGTFGFVLYEVL